MGFAICVLGDVLYSNKCSFLWSEGSGGDKRLLHLYEDICTLFSRKHLLLIMQRMDIDLVMIYLEYVGGKSMNNSVS